MRYGTITLNVIKGTIAFAVEQFLSRIMVLSLPSSSVQIASTLPRLAH